MNKRNCIKVIMVYNTIMSLTLNRAKKIATVVASGWGDPGFLSRHARLRI